MTASSLIEAFDNCPSLQSATICVDHADEMYVLRPQEGVKMLQLRQLVVEYCSGPDEFFDLLTSPSLTEFIAHSKVGWAHWPHTVFMEFLIRSQASLHIIKIEHIDLESHEMLELIDAAPHLSELHLYNHPMAPIYEHLEVWEGRPIILPQLQALFVHARASSMAPEELYKLIELRAPNHPSKAVHLQFWDEGDRFEFKTRSFARL